MEEYRVGSVAASVSGGKASSAALSKLFAAAPTGSTIRYVPVKQQAQPQEVKLKSPVHKSVREQVSEKKKNKQRTEVAHIKKRSIQDVFDSPETEPKNVLKKKKKKAKVELNSEEVAMEFIKPKKKKKKVKFEVEAEVEAEEPEGEIQHTFKKSKKHKKSKKPFSESTELMEAMPVGKKKKKQKERNDINTEDVEKEVDDTEEYNEDQSRSDESAEEDEEELSNKKCALKRLEKKRLKELKLQHIDKEQDARTVFVGNVPNDIDKKKLKKFFSKFGAVKSVRLRCAPLADPRVPKKVAIIRQKYHPERSSIHAFVCFEDEKSTHKALEANGMVLEEHHIRVDLLNNKQAHDQKKAVFVGNLPFAAEEDDLWKLFEPCGAINSVRIVRDKVSGVGKGFAYVNFETVDAVELAVKMDGEELNKRKLRISRYARKPVGRFVNKRIMQKPAFRKNVRAGSSTQERKHTEIFKHKKKAEKNTKFAQSGSHSAVVKKKLKATYQGQKIAEKAKLKKNKKKINKNEIKKKILIGKLGIDGKMKKRSKKVTFQQPSS